MCATLDFHIDFGFVESFNAVAVAYGASLCVTLDYRIEFGFVEIFNAVADACGVLIVRYVGFSH